MRPSQRSSVDARGVDIFEEQGAELAGHEPGGEFGVVASDAGVEEGEKPGGMGGDGDLGLGASAEPEEEGVAAIGDAARGLARRAPLVVLLRLEEIPVDVGKVVGDLGLEASLVAGVLSRVLGDVGMADPRHFRSELRRGELRRLYRASQRRDDDQVDPAQRGRHGPQRLGLVAPDRRERRVDEFRPDVRALLVLPRRVHLAAEVPVQVAKQIVEPLPVSNQVDHLPTLRDGRARLPTPRSHRDIALQAQDALPLQLLVVLGRLDPCGRLGALRVQR
mmetsp:Transcript_9535/g.30511  ORF Transcript_9535/g.30511 Transcript_9535/m.30511 type:complete len:277 (-) Transcript_9535:88-918(-)